MKKCQNNEATNNAVVTGRKLDLSTIADLMALETNGFISKDLYDALKLAESKGLCAEDKQLPEFILWEDRKLDYDAEKLSKEADCVLLLRAKCGDEAAFNKLFVNKKAILNSLANTVAIKYSHCGNVLENEYEDYEQKMYETFYYHVMDCPICSHEKISFSHSGLNYKICDNIYKKVDFSSDFVNYGVYGYKASKIKRQLEATNTDVKSMTYEMYEDYCVSQGYTSSSAKKMYEATLQMDNAEIYRHANRKKGVRDIEDGSTRKGNVANIEAIAATAENGFYVDGKKYDDFDPANLDFEKSPFMNYLDKYRHDEKHGRDVETLIAHVYGESDADLSNKYAENAPTSPSREETAKLMDYESSYEVKKALKRAKEFIFSTLKKEDPELLEELLKGRNRAV